MTDLHPGENEQTRLWNGTVGRAWADTQDLLDHVFKPIEQLLVSVVAKAATPQVLDVGCGTGATTLAIARRLGAQGCCVGIDISEPMLATARTRAAQERTSATFIHANAQSHAFEPARFDMIVSRFGVMFFEDPVAAFTNLRRAARNEAQLRLIAWRGPAENPFMTTAGRAAAPLLPNLPTRRPDEPGQFAFADRNRVGSILQKSGWTGIDIQPVDFSCTLPTSELVRYFTRIGPVGLCLQEADERTREQVVAVVRPAFEPFVHSAEVRFTAACWMVAASAEGARGDRSI